MEHSKDVFQLLFDTNTKLHEDCIQVLFMIVVNKILCYITENLVLHF